MESTRALKQLLEEISTLDYDGGLMCRVVEGDGSHADIDGAYVQVDSRFPDDVDPEVDDTNQLRTVCDIHAHEMEHIRSSVLTSKRDFSKQYPECPKLAGWIINLLEDEFVDAERCRRNPGMKRSRAYRVMLTMQTEDQAPDISELDVERQFVAGIFQLALGGYVNGYDDAEPEVREFLRTIRSDLEQVRRTRDAGRRYRIAERVMDTLLEYVEKHDTPEIPPQRTRNGDGGGDGTESSMTEETAKKLDEAAEERADDVEGGAGEDFSFETEYADDDESGDDADDGESDDEHAGDDGDGDDESDDTDDEESSHDGESGSESDGGDDGDDEGESLDGDVSDITEKYGIDEDEDSLRTPSSIDRSRYERYEEKLDSYDTLLEEKRRERDDRIKARAHAADDLRARSRRQVDDVTSELESMITRETPKPERSGERMNRRNTVRRAAGDIAETKLYEQPETTSTGDRLVAVTSDISGSIRLSRNMDDLKQTIGILGEAVEAVDDDFLATCFTDNSNWHDKASRDGPNIVTDEVFDLRLINAADEDWDWEHLDSFEAEDNEPIATGMKFTKALMDNETAEEKVMFVITDGRALVTADGRYDTMTDEPKRDVLEMKRQIEADDVTVIGIGFDGADKTAMRKSFGETGWVTTDVDSLADEVVGAYKELVGG